MEHKVSEGGSGGRGVGAVCLFFLAAFNTWCVHACMFSCFSHVRLFVTLWTIAPQAPLPMGFSRQEYWTGLPCPPPGDLSDPGIKSASLMSPALAGKVFTTSTTWEAPATTAVSEKSARTLILFSHKRLMLQPLFPGVSRNSVGEPPHQVQYSGTKESQSLLLESGHQRVCSLE